MFECPTSFITPEVRLIRGYLPPLCGDTLPELGPLLTASLILAGTAFASAVALIVLDNLVPLPRILPGALWTLLVYGCAGLVSNLLMGEGYEAAPVLGLGLAVALGTKRLLPDFTPAGRLLLVTHGQLALFALIWAGWFISTIPVSELTRGLMFAGYAILILTVPATLVGKFEEWEALCRQIWRRPRTPLPAQPRDTYPKVSLHVPTYAEPPELVIATLDALARLRYPNFEVLVIDNNTKDPALWRPVEEHCLRLGKAFRFFHVDPLSGAKAGAVNFALRHTAPDAELIGVLDSDYQAEPDFLERLIGFFDDPKVGFVQTPHDYREWQDSVYQRMCYWEYAYGVKNLLAALNEHGAAYTIGTMCLIRRRALEEVGGWAEWCLTEDSELAIRIYALGYSGVYLTTTFGRGLIPETFLDYKNQRFRWACGPIQQLTHHFRLLLPRRFGYHPSSSLTAAQKIHELSHGLGLVNVGLSLLIAFLGALTLASMLLHQEIVAVPLALVWTLVVFVTTGGALRWLIYRVVLGCSLWDTFGAFLAKSALSYTIAVASLSGVLNRPALWRRTNKFPVLPMGLGALDGVRAELILGIGALSIGVGGLAAAPEFGLHTLLATGVISQGLSYLAAPVLALLAERDVRRRYADRTHQHTQPPNVHRPLSPTQTNPTHSIG